MKQELAYRDANVSVSPKRSKPTYMDAKASSTLIMIGMPYSVAFHPGLWAVFAINYATTQCLPYQLAYVRLDIQT